MPAAVAGVVLAATAALRLRDPHVAGSWGTCPFLALTGLPCPACGGLRAVNDLTHGRLLDAVSSNLLVVLLVPAAVWFWVQWVRGGLGRRPPVGSGPVRMWLVWTVLVGTLVFGVVRNLPFGAWLAP